MNFSMSFDQVAIVGLSAVTMWISQSGSERWRKWAPILGLISQPFWFYTAWTHGQGGVFISSFFYTAAWLRGIYTYWILPRRKK